MFLPIKVKKKTAQPNARGVGRGGKFFHLNMQIEEDLLFTLSKLLVLGLTIELKVSSE